MDISGIWNYTEDFYYGNDVGTATLTVDGEKVNGVMEYNEIIPDDGEFRIKQTVEGSFDGTNLVLKGTHVEILKGPENMEYHPDVWEAQLTSEGKFVGSSCDNAEICGVFVLER
ncbi:hypothetical protein EYV94_10030 [Puteibacter caeruleilacunae]|nr:hypothetical protein EYV94_10030 [Puteibacter caeruleilacunae]